jgi:DNA-binding NarL/FixJ family response regulator
MLLVVTENVFLGELVADQLNHSGIPALALTVRALVGFLDQNRHGHVVVVEESGAAGHDLCRHVIGCFPEVTVVQLGEGRSIQDVRAAYAAGAHAVVPKTPRLEELITVVNELRPQH